MRDLSAKEYEELLAHAAKLAAAEEDFLRETQAKAKELGGKISFVHDEYIIDMSLAAFQKLRVWAQEHPAPASVKRAFL